jgi:hypothetical protein
MARTPEEAVALHVKAIGDTKEIKMADAGSEHKIAYRVLATRFHADGTPMQGFEAIYSVLKMDEDWRVVNRNPINVFPA